MSKSFIATEVALALLSGVVSTVLAILALRISPQELGLRWGTGGSDQVLHYEIFSSALHTFPYVPNPQLGFPEAQNLFFAPLFDIWSALEVWVMSFVVPDGIAALNIYNILSFFSVGVTSYLFFRALKLRRSTSTVFGVVFAVVPYHFYQLALGHPFLSNYWAVPLIGILALMVAGERTNPFAQWVSRAPSRRSGLVRRVVPIVVLGGAVGWTQSYYFVFGALIVASVWVVAALVAVVDRAGWRRMIWPTVTTGVLFVLVGLQLAVLSLGLDDRYAKYFSARTPADSELYGGKLINLLLPSGTSGIPLLAKPASNYQAVSQILTTSESASTAALGSVAIILAMATLLVRALWRGRSESTRWLPRFIGDERVGVLLVGFLVAVLFFTVSGLGTLLAFVFSPEIRAWSRMSIVVSLFALAILAVLIESITRRVWVRVVVLAAVSGFAAADQLGAMTTNFPLQTTPDDAARSVAAAATTMLSPGCGVVELPLKGFPETGPIGRMGDYDEALPYIYEEGGIEWSYGAVLGTKSADYWAGVSDPAVFADKAKSAETCAVLVDTYAYTDSGPTWEPFVDSVARSASPDFVSDDADHRYELFVLPAGN